MKPIRILHVVTVMNLGGIETLLMSLYRNINRDIIQFDFLVHRSEKGFFDDEILSLGGNIFRVSPLKPLKYYSYKREIKTLLDRYKYNVIHSHLNSNSTIVLAIAKNIGVKWRIAHSHADSTSNNFKGLLKFILKRNINKVCNYRMACSNSAGLWLFGKHCPFVVFKNAIETEKFIFNEKNRMQIRRKYGIKPNEIVFGNIGRFSYEKNHIFLIRVFNEIKRLKPNSKLMLIGEGDLFNQIEEYVFKYNLEDNLIFTGAIDNVNEYLNAMDVFLFPSLFEGLGIVGIEAQANGLPIVLNEDLPKELDLTNLVYRVSLNDSEEHWAKRALLVYENNSKRESREKELKSKGYDISTNVKVLTSIYSQFF